MANGNGSLMSNKKYGLKYERKEKQFLMEQGYVANRNRGSFGGWDMVACNKEHFLLTNVKSTKQKYYSFVDELKYAKEFDNAPKGTIKMFVLYQNGKRKVLYEGIV